MKILIASDHRGYKLKQELIKKLSKKYEIEDLGPKKYNPKDDYPDFAIKVAKKVSKENKRIGRNKVFGILICSSSVGMIIAANKYKNVRAVSVFNQKQAKNSREHNDTNIIGLSAETTKAIEAMKIINVWLDTDFSNEARHIRRLEKIRKIETQ